MYRKYTANVTNLIRRQTIEAKTLVKRTLKENANRKQQTFDVAIFGGGIMGLFTSFWLKRQCPSLNILVIERDPQYKTASTVLSVGGIRHQFSLRENIALSKFGSEFIANINEYLSVPGNEIVDIQFQENGYLFLASTEQGEQLLRENHRLQCELNACTELMRREQLCKKFPWLNVDDIRLGCLGVRYEGFFDPYLLLMAVKRKAIHMGVKYVNAEVVQFVLKSTGGSISNEICNSVVIKFPNGKESELNFSKGVIAAGPHSGQMSRLLKIGEAVNDCRKTHCPVEPRKRYVFSFDCPTMRSIRTPLVIDPSCVYFRSDGNHFLAGKSPEPVKLLFSNEEPDTNNLEVDYEYFDEQIWPVLASRVKAFEEIKVNGAWSGFYEFNTLDENQIIGMHPYYSNLYWITGFSGHGIQMAIAAGRSVSELILYGKYRSIDVSRLGWQRIIDNAPLFESCIV
ncbi:FAD-dependent oxidoreductase domain-containing protein 1-like isoform X5 [Leptotrombidium deliense]|uniref:FAD-dependent oxidoreductase domain-containing protein 1 n=1 Tax=Leptotrombidium deliense TaxID=299467 RepID=A0A443SNW5_9ACAR|nr:FAD-dependent oxidoreductase domain-containing protein 1-like isoform X5 [Leptotrombidium deliense]